MMVSTGTVLKLMPWNHSLALVLPYIVSTAIGNRQEHQQPYINSNLIPEYKICSCIH